MKAKLLMLFSAILLISGLNAQILEPVKWDFSKNKISENEKTKNRFPNNRWHCTLCFLSYLYLALYWK